MARRLSWIRQFIAANSHERPMPNPLETPTWYSLTPNTIGTPVMHQKTFGNKTGGFGATDIAYAAGPWRLLVIVLFCKEGVT